MICLAVGRGSEVPLDPGIALNKPPWLELGTVPGRASFGVLTWARATLEWRLQAGDFKKDAGMELRLETFSFYAYPTRIFFNASYGFDKFTQFIKTRNETVTYGREWRFYFGVLFGFDLD